MEQLRIFLVFGFLAVIGRAQNISRPSYLISVSNIIRPGIPTTVSVTNLGDAPVLVISEIIHGNSSVDTQSFISGGSTEVQVIPAISEDVQSYWLPYELVVKGSIDGTPVFSNSTMLNYNPKSLAILLQTDKANYKPGQAVKIRAVIINSDGKPSRKQIDIVIMDPKQNIVHQWLAVDTVLGTASREFQLSKNPPLGEWKIQASVDKVTQEQTFVVSYYVLPKFEAVIEAPERLYYEDLLKYTVNAQYFYGKGVAGKLIVTYVHGFHGVEAHYEEEKLINGLIDLSFDVPELYRKMRSEDYGYYGSNTGDYIDINVQVTELLTGVVQNSSVRVSIVMTRYNLEFLQYPPTIKPSFSFSAQLKLSTYNKQPLTKEDQNRTVVVTISQQSLSPWNMGWGNVIDFLPRNFSISEPEISTTTAVPYPSGKNPVEKLQLPVPADGVIPLNIQLSENVATLTIEAQYEDAQNTLQLYKEYLSPTESYIQLRSTGQPKIGLPLQMSVESNFNLTVFHYMVISRAQVVAAGTLSSSGFTLTPDVSWVPLATVLVYCIRPDGEIINDAVEISFLQVLKNNVSLKWKTESEEPARPTTLTVSVAEPESLVGILIVDKASLDSERTNEITEQKVKDELAKFTTEVYQKWGGIPMRDPYSLFSESGLTVLTDANLGPAFSPIIMFDALPGGVEEVMILNKDEQQQQLPQRTYFPETWLWLDIRMNDSTSTSIPLTTPDSITSWVATAFVISEDLGLGISASAELEVFKDFFLSLNLPAYIIRGELLLLEVNLFNYLDKDLEVIVMVSESSMFEFVSPDGGDASLDNIRRVSVRSQNGTTALFPIRATKLGEMPISVKVQSLGVFDSVQQTILVKPEGMEQSLTQTLFLEFPPQKSNMSKELEFTFPPNVVPDSQRAIVTAVGDILGPSISGLEALIQMPYGCGEQNMINFAPNVYILQYLSTTGRVDEEIRSRALSYMTQGYERELSYQRVDGSFSAFGDSDSSGSTWLSAFVLKCFLQARAYIFIDEAVLTRAVNWLRYQQTPEGNYEEPGRVIHTELQGGLDGSVSLTAYVLVGLLEDEEYSRTHADQVTAAVNYLTSKLSQGISSNYSLCLVTYALSLAKSPSASIALTQLISRAQMVDDVPMWGSGLRDGQPGSVDIEMAAYTLLSFFRQGNVEQGFSLMKWLSQQRNHLGGYSSTQDTIIALQALSAYATLNSVDQIDLSITVTDPQNKIAHFTINQANYLLQQIQEIEAKNVLSLRVSAVGRGFALFQLTTFYNIKTDALSRRRRDSLTNEAFNLDIYIIDNDIYNISITICFSLSESQQLNQTGMAILDVGLLTGFSLAQKGIPIDKVVRKVETSPGKVILYLDSVTKTSVCVDIPTALEVKVTSVQDAIVTIYDYYAPQRRTVKTYTSESRRNMPVCDICGGDCSLCGSNVVSVYDSALSSQQNHCLVQILALVVLIIMTFSF